MNFEKVLETLLMIGSDLPAYKALFEQVASLFSDDDQDKLKAAYAEAMAASDAAHKAAQELGE